MINFYIMTLLAIIPLVLYIIFFARYFLITDPKPLKSVKTKGLSRTCIRGQFILFGLIFLMLSLQFISSFFTLINSDEKFNETLSKYSLIFFAALKSSNQQAPLDILININIGCTALYTGTEGIIASLKTLDLDNGLSVELPYMKRRRMSTIYHIWVAIVIISLIYYYLTSTGENNYHIKNSCIGLGSSLLIMFAADRSPEALKTVTLTKENCQKMTSKRVEI